MHRAWPNIKSTITGMSEHAVLAECERGEDAAKAAYEAALQKSLPADVRSLSSGNTKASRQITIESAIYATPQPDNRVDSGRPGNGHGPAVEISERWARLL